MISFIRKIITLEGLSRRWQVTVFSSLGIAAVQAGATDKELEPARTLIRHAQFRWDYVSSNNGMGFHSPQEYMRISGAAAGGAQQARLQVARLLAEKGFTDAPVYPDISTREKALEVARGFMDGRGARLLR